MSDISLKIGQQIVREVMGSNLASEALAQGLSPILEAVLGATIKGIGGEETEKSWALFLATSLRFAEVGSKTRGFGTLGGRVGPDLSGLPEDLKPAIGNFAHLLGQPLRAVLDGGIEQEVSGKRPPPEPESDDLRTVISKVLHYAAKQSNPSIEAVVDELVKIVQEQRDALFCL